MLMKKLRVKFVAVNLLIVTLMLGAIFGLVYHFTRENLENDSLRMMQSFGSFPHTAWPPGKEMNHLPCFSIQRGLWGEIVVTGSGYYDLTDEDLLIALYQQAQTSGMQSGVIEPYGLRYWNDPGSPELRTVFTDISSERATLKSLVQTCVLIGGLAFFVFFAVSLVLARWAVRPMELMWEQQRQFVADASHELKTPLSVIMTNAELLQAVGDDSDRKSRVQFSRSILVMSRQMRSLVEGLLELARFDSGSPKSSPEIAPIDLSALVSEGLLPFEAVFYERGLSLESRIEPEIRLNGDSGKLREVLEILLDNARKYTSEGGDVRITLENRGRNHCRLSVSSTGDPLSKEDLKNIFRRFYRADPSRSKKMEQQDASFGLGLAIAKSIVEQHHGKIWAQSENGQNIFFVELPANERKDAKIPVGKA